MTGTTTSECCRNFKYACCRWWHLIYWVYLSSDHLFQVYYKVRQVLLQRATAFFITKCDGLLLQSATAFLLQSATSVITKCDRFYKMWQFISKCDRYTYYRVRRLLQSGTEQTIITNATCRLRSSHTCHFKRSLFHFNWLKITLFFFCNCKAYMVILIQWLCSIVAFRFFFEYFITFSLSNVSVVEHEIFYWWIQDKWWHDTSAILVRYSTNWAVKPHIGSKVNLLSSYLPVQWNDVKNIWNSCLYCGCRWKWRVIIAVNCPIKPLEGRLKPEVNWLSSYLSWVGRAWHRYCLNWTIYCNDHSWLKSTAAVQIWISYMSQNFSLAIERNSVRCWFNNLGLYTFVE